MSRFTRNTVIQAQLEVTYGVDPGSWLSTHAILCSDPDFKIDRNVVPRNLRRSFMGGSEHLVGTRRAELSFSVELQSSGTAGTPPAWGPLVRACGMAQTTFAGSRVEWTPVSSSFSSLTMRFFRDGVLYVARGCRGTFELDLTAYQIPRLMFKMTGFDVSASSVALPATDYSAFRRPVVLTDANSGEVRLGCSYASGALSSGVLLAHRGLTLDVGNTVSHIELIGGEEIDISDREVSGSLTVFLPASDEITWRTDINANTLTSMGFAYGTSAGSKVCIFLPSVQRVNPQSVDYQGRVCTQVELRVLPSGASGNDEMRLVAL